jgi:hypothetical protein
VRTRGSLPLLGAIVLAAVPYRAFFTERVPVGRDLLQYFYPLKAHLAEGFAHGELPWVDRFRWGGVPLLGGPSAAPFDPANILFLTLPLGAAMKAWILLHLALLLVGFAAFARRLGLAPAAAAVAGLAFTLAGTTVSVAPFPPTLSALSVLPWLAAFVLDAVREPSFLSAAKAGSAAALLLAASSPEYALYAAVVSFAILVAVPAGANGPPPHRSRALAALAGAAAITAGLAAVVLVPTAAATLQSARGPGGGQAPGSSGSGALAQARIGELVIDGLVADWTHVVAAPDVPSYPYIPSATPGRVVWLLALAGLALGGPLRGASALLAALGVALALGRATPVLGLAERVLPPLAALRYPERHLALFGFGVATLAGLGLARIDAALSARARRLVLPLLSLAILLDRERMARGLSPVEDPSVLTRPPALLGSIPRAGGDVPPPRIFHRDLWNPVPVFSRTDLAASDATARETLIPAYASLFGAGYVFEKDYDLSLSAEAFEWQRLLARAVPAPGPFPLRLVRAAGASAVLVSERTADGRYRPHLLRIGDAVPPFRFASRIVASSNAPALFARLLEDGIPPDTAYVDADVSGLAAPSPGSVVAVRDRPSGLEMDVAVGGPADGFLMVWRLHEAAAEARVDGRRVSTLPMAFGFAGVRVPPGPHVVALRPDTRWVKIGASISAASVLVLVLVFLLARARRVLRSKRPS